MSKKTAIPAMVLAVVMVVFAGIWYAAKPATAAGEKHLTVEVIHSDLSKKEYDITTAAEYLDEALVENGVVEDNRGTYGLYILTADGETVNEADQEWWCITRGGESLTTGASETPIADGDAYELTFTVGYGS